MSAGKKRGVQKRCFLHCGRCRGALFRYRSKPILFYRNECFIFRNNFKSFVQDPRTRCRSGNLACYGLYVLLFRFCRRSRNRNTLRSRCLCRSAEELYDENRRAPIVKTFRRRNTDFGIFTIYDIRAMPRGIHPCALHVNGIGKIYREIFSRV